MRIAFASDNAYPWFNGGIEKRRFLIAQEFVKAGHEVHFFTMLKKDMKSRDFIKDGIHYHCTSNASNSEKLYVNGRRNIWWAIKHSTLLLFRMLPYKFDFVDVDAFPFFSVISADAYCKIKGSKLVVTWYEAWSREYWKTYLGKYKGDIGYGVEYAAALLSGKAVAISTATQDSLSKLFGVKKSQICVLPAAISSDEIKEVPRRKAKDTRAFVIASRLVPEKRVDIAIRAMKKVDAKLVVLGVGPEQHRLKRLANQLGISNKIMFKDRLARGQLFGQIRSSRGLVVTSEREGLSIITLESIALGTPVFILRSTMLPKEVRKYCFEAKDGSLANLLAKALGTAAFKARARANKAAVAREFSSAATIRTYEKLLGARLR